MSRLIITGLPEPPAGEFWCAVCVADYKYVLVHLPGMREKIEKILTGPDDEVGAITAPRGAKLPPLEPGITITIIERFGGAPVLSCWTHASAADLQPDEPPPGFRRSNLIPGMS